MSGRPLNARRTSSYLTAPRTPYSYGGSSGSSLNSLVDDYSYGWSEPSTRLFSRQSTPQPEERINSGSNALVPTIRRRSSSSVSSIRTAASDTAAADDATPPRMLEFAKQKNPTLSVRLSRRLTWECTYAELLQYASALLSARRLARLWWPPASRWQTQSTFSSVGGSEEAAAASMPVALLVANAAVFLVALATLDMRRNGEKLGLRRTWLVLCAALFITSCLVAVWPASSSSSLSSNGGLSAKAASDMAKHSIDDIERIVAARIATWRGSAHAATSNTARFEVPNWPTDAAADTAIDAVIRQAQICTLPVHEQAWQQYKCHDVDDKVHAAARGMFSKDDGSDQVAHLCAQLPDGQASMLRVQLRNKHTIMIMCSEHE